ncbi:GyrI-like domain-containing protein [Solirubrobacter sp. CPCC 204708]|uniref:GyrI-like domain-containing protein n=1 Tax=Solirubrobacter deserti TaxID=2282478 RepID=A0ABT4RJ27_9ACTN|nr:GyrI-like domain-containing protein [Solirubrobacter deserti]MBE2320913.1 GyrI-like domain-containing protein [Solirubrobacter deserti]MDA0138549.1 GyrI-like domain-containing protein [Solirubrobacter deserti]
MSDIPSTEHFSASDAPELVVAPSATFVATTGSGRPGSDAFYRKHALIADVARALADNGLAPTTPPVIEMLFWYPDHLPSADIADFYSLNPIPSLLYRVTARIDEHASADDIARARSAAASEADRPDELLERYVLKEHAVVQVMHHGPFANEFATLARLGEFAQRAGLRRAGPHREIHLDSFTRTTPQDGLRTILRDPVA